MKNFVDYPRYSLSRMDLSELMGIIRHSNPRSVNACVELIERAESHMRYVGESARASKYSNVAIPDSADDPDFKALYCAAAADLGCGMERETAIIYTIDGDEDLCRRDSVSLDRPRNIDPSYMHRFGVLLPEGSTVRAERSRISQDGSPRYLVTCDGKPAFHRFVGPVFHSKEVGLKLKVLCEGWDFTEDDLKAALATVDVDCDTEERYAPIDEPTHIDLKREDMLRRKANTSVTSYELIERIVKSGNSKVFKNWHEHTGLSQEDFLAGMKWLIESEFPGGEYDGHKLRYRLGCTRNGEIVKIKAHLGYLTTLYRMDNGELWANGPYISVIDRV